MYGKDIEFLIKQDEENAGKPGWNTPAAISEMPILEIWESSYINAFYSLTSSRQVGMGVGAIPLSEIFAYCNFFDISEPELFVYVIQKCDNTYLEEYNKAQEAKSKKK